MLDIFNDDNFTIPLDRSYAPTCPVCGGALWVEVDERYSETGLPTPTGFTPYCLDEINETKPPMECCRVWTYDELLTAVGEVREWFEKEAEARRQWELCLWGETEISEVA